MSSQENIIRMQLRTIIPAMTTWLLLQVSGRLKSTCNFCESCIFITLIALNIPAPPMHIQLAKKTECRKQGAISSSAIEEGIPAAKVDDEGVYVVRASASYIHALREALGRKILYSAYPTFHGKDQGQNVQPANSADGVFIDVNNQFNVVTIDGIVYAECLSDNFLVRCGDNAAFSGSTGDFIGYWQNEGHILTD